VQLMLHMPSDDETREKLDSFVHGDRGEPHTGPEGEESGDSRTATPEAARVSGRRGGRAP
jgi:hypothetical protein